MPRSISQNFCCQCPCPHSEPQPPPTSAGDPPTLAETDEMYLAPEIISSEYPDKHTDTQLLQLKETEVV